MDTSKKQFTLWILFIVIVLILLPGNLILLKKQKMNQPIPDDLKTVITEHIANTGNIPSDVLTQLQSDMLNDSDFFQTPEGFRFVIPKNENGRILLMERDHFITSCIEIGNIRSYLYLTTDGSRPAITWQEYADGKPLVSVKMENGQYIDIDGDKLFDLKTDKQNKVSIRKGDTWLPCNTVKSGAVWTAVREDENYEFKNGVWELKKAAKEPVPDAEKAK